MQITMTKKTIIFLHGWGGRANTWKKQISFFQRHNFEVLNMELPGFDLPEPDPSWGIPEYADYVIAKLPNRQKKYVFVGHSFGGRISTYIACHHPEVVDRLVLTDSAGLNIEEHSGRIILIFLSRAVDRFQEYVPYVLNIRGVLRRFLGSKNFKEATPVMREVMKKVVNLDLVDCLPRIKAKTLIIWGDKDKITPLSMAYAFHNGIKGSVLKSVSGAEHWPYMSHSNEWNSAVLGFLSE